MAEDLPAEEILKQLNERLELLERVLATNTARLHGIEKHLGIPDQQQRISEIFDAAKSEMRAAEKGDTHVPAGQAQPPVLKQDSDSSSAPGSPPATPPREEPLQPTSSKRSPAQTWPPTQPSEQPGLRSETARPSTTEQRPTPGHSSTSDASDSHTYSTRPADAPFTLNVEDSAEDFTDVSREEKRRDLEATIGGSWFNWIGIIAVTFGIAFFLKYAFDKQWIGPLGRVSIAAFVGIALLYLGDRLRRRGLKSYAYVLSGGGILILYLSDFAAYNFYQLISQPTAFVLMAAVTTTAVLLSVRLDATPVAFLGLVGGFLTPVLLSTGVDNQVGLFTYIALLDAGVLAVAYFKRWRSLDFASFTGTVLMTLGWAVKFYEPGKVWITLFFLSVFFLLYSMLPIFHNVLHRRLTQWFDVMLALVNAAFYFGLSYVLLVDAGLNHTTPATQAFLLCIFFTGLFYITWRRSPQDLLLRYSYVCAAATYLTVAIAIQLELHWVTMAWAVEGLMLTWVGLRSGEKAPRHAGLAVLGVAIGRWFVRDMLAVDYSLDTSFIPLLNQRALSCAVLVGAIAWAAQLYHRTENVKEDYRSTVLTFFALTGNTLALSLLTLDINDYFSMRASHSGGDFRARIENSRQFSISMLWTLYAATMVAVGVLRRSALLRRGGLALLLVVIAKVVAVDSDFYAASWHLPLLNQTFMVYAVLIAALVFAAWLYRRASIVDEGEQRIVVPLVISLANVLALTALSLEIIGYYDRSIARLAMAGTETLRQLEEGKIFTLALVWTIYALYAFMVGVGRNKRAWRLAGLLLLAITAPLVFANLPFYNAPWHTFIFNRTMGAFAVFIAALWLIVRAYRRSGEVFEEAAAVHHAAIVTANVLAIIALSAQAAGYYEARIAEEFAREGAAELYADGSTTLQNLELAKQLSLSVIWAVYASGLLFVGQIRRLRLLRLLGLGLLSVTVLKVFIWDLSSLDRVYRIISFIMLGAILLVVSYFYQRGQHPAAETSNE
jgi:uncharacterized membrane protein